MFIEEFGRPVLGDAQRSVSVDRKARWRKRLSRAALASVVLSGAGVVGSASPSDALFGWGGSDDADDNGDTDDSSGESNPEPVSSVFGGSDYFSAPSAPSVSESASASASVSEPSSSFGSEEKSGWDERQDENARAASVAADAAVEPVSEPEPSFSAFGDVHPSAEVAAAVDARDEAAAVAANESVFGGERSGGDERAEQARSAAAANDTPAVTWAEDQAATQLDPVTELTETAQNNNTADAVELSDASSQFVDLTGSSRGFGLVDQAGSMGLADALALKEALADGELSETESALLSASLNQTPPDSDGSDDLGFERSARVADAITEANASGIDTDQAWAEMGEALVGPAKFVTPYGSGEDAYESFVAGNYGAAALGAGLVGLEMTPAKLFVAGGKAAKLAKAADELPDSQVIETAGDIGTDLVVSQVDDVTKHIADDIPVQLVANGDTVSTVTKTAPDLTRAANDEIATATVRAIPDSGVVKQVPDAKAVAANDDIAGSLAVPATVSIGVTATVIGIDNLPLIGDPPAEPESVPTDDGDLDVVDPVGDPVEETTPPESEPDTPGEEQLPAGYPEQNPPIPVESDTEQPDEVLPPAETEAETTPEQQPALPDAETPSEDDETVPEDPDNNTPPTETTPQPGIYQEPNNQPPQYGTGYLIPHSISTTPTITNSTNDNNGDDDNKANENGSGDNQNPEQPDDDGDEDELTQEKINAEIRQMWTDLKASTDPDTKERLAEQLKANDFIGNRPEVNFIVAMDGSLVKFLMFGEAAEYIDLGLVNDPSQDYVDALDTDPNTNEIFELEAAKIVEVHNRVRESGVDANGNSIGELVPEHRLREDLPGTVEMDVVPFGQPGFSSSRARSPEDYVKAFENLLPIFTQLERDGVITDFNDGNIAYNDENEVTALIDFYGVDAPSDLPDQETVAVVLANYFGTYREPDLRRALFESVGLIDATGQENESRIEAAQEIYDLTVSPKRTAGKAYSLDPGPAKLAYNLILENARELQAGGQANAADTPANQDATDTDIEQATANAHETRRLANESEDRLTAAIKASGLTIPAEVSADPLFQESAAEAAQLAADARAADAALRTIEKASAGSS